MTDADSWMNRDGGADETIHPRKTLFVRRLCSQTTEDSLTRLFSPFGPVKSCQIIADSGPTLTRHAIIEFWDHTSAAIAHATMNTSRGENGQTYVDWATTTAAPAPSSLSLSPNAEAQPYRICVGNLNYEMGSQALRNGFARFGEMSECEIMISPRTLKSKGYGFITFLREEDAQAAMAEMNGRPLMENGRNLRLIWTVRENEVGEEFLNVYRQSSPRNSIIHFCRVDAKVSRKLILTTFVRFGLITRIYIARNRKYAYIRFAMKEFAAKAIVGVDGTEINGHMVKCWWARELADPGDSCPSQNEVPVAAVTPIPQQHDDDNGYDESVFGAGNPQWNSRGPPSTTTITDEESAETGDAGCIGPCQVPDAAPISQQHGYDGAGQQMGYWLPPVHLIAPTITPQMQNQLAQGRLIEWSPPWISTCAEPEAVVGGTYATQQMSNVGVAQGNYVVANWNWHPQGHPTITATSMARMQENSFALGGGISGDPFWIGGAGGVPVASHQMPSGGTSNYAAAWNGTYPQSFEYRAAEEGGISAYPDRF